MNEQLQHSLLVVDDDEDITRMITRFLSSRGHNCVTAHTGAQGAVEFNAEDTALIITDLNMPAGDGIALITRIRRESAVPIIVVTAFNREYSTQLHSFPGVTVLRKPFDAYALLDLVELELGMRNVA